MNNLFVVLAGCAFVGAAGCVPTTTSQTESFAEAPTVEPAADNEKMADEETKTADAASGPLSHDPNERICKRVKSTGSNFSRRRCQTRAAWDAEREAAQDAVDRLDRKNREGCTLAQKASGC